jgi:hypothetical protein
VTIFRDKDNRNISELLYRIEDFVAPVMKRDGGRGVLKVHEFRMKSSGNEVRCFEKENGEGY